MQDRLLNSGSVFNHLRVIGLNRNKVGANGKRYYLCQCVCGKVVSARTDALTSNIKSSCGCQPKMDVIKSVFKSKWTEKHGLAKDRLYWIYWGARNRCHNPQSRHYKDYGGRGISMCHEWLSDVTSFYQWAKGNGYSTDLQLDRENNNEGYSPENCRFVTRKVNMNNRRCCRKYEYEGSPYTIQELSALCHVKESTLRARIDRDGKPVKDAVELVVKAHEPSLLSDSQRQQIALAEESVSILAKTYNVPYYIINNIKRKFFLNLKTKKCQNKV